GYRDGVGEHGRLVGWDGRESGDGDLSDTGRTGWGLHVGGVPFRLVRGARRVGAGPGRGGGYSAASLGFSGMSRTASHDAARPARALQLAALVVYVAVVLALTVGKSFYQIGLLWKPEN